MIFIQKNMVEKCILVISFINDISLKFIFIANIMPHFFFCYNIILLTKHLI